MKINKIIKTIKNWFTPDTVLISMEELFIIEYEKQKRIKEEEETRKAQDAEDERVAEEKAVWLQKTIIEWQRLAGIEPERTLELLIPIKEGKTEKRRSVDFANTKEMTTYLNDNGFVPYDLEYVEEARTGRYKFIRIKNQNVKDFFEFPDAKFNGPDFYTPYKQQNTIPVVFGPYLAQHQFSYPSTITEKDIEAAGGKLSVLRPQSDNMCWWEQKDGVFYPKNERDFRDVAIEEEAKESRKRMLEHFEKYDKLR